MLLMPEDKPSVIGDANEAAQKMVSLENKRSVIGHEDSSLLSREKTLMRTSTTEPQTWKRVHVVRDMIISNQEGAPRHAIMESNQRCSRT